MPTPKKSPATPLGHDMSYAAFVKAMGTRESSNNYRAKNQYGYLGRFQFGMARLCDLGLTERLPGTKGYAAKHFRWRQGLSEELFLSTPPLQDLTFDRHVGLLAQVVEGRYKKHLGKTVSGLKVTLSGAIAVCHLLGEGGLKAFLEGKDGADALGTTASDYLKLFSGYDIPKSTQKLAALSLTLGGGDDVA